MTDLDRLAADTAALAWQLHDEDPTAVHAALAQMDRLRLEQVCCAALAMVDVDRTTAELLAWTEQLCTAVCGQCGGTFRVGLGRKFCSPACRLAASRERRRSRRLAA